MGDNKIVLKETGFWDVDWIYMAGSGVHENEPAGSINGGDFFD
jgi:hypothetical protein